MEPFDLALNQVNIEEKDITADDSLNAFSDVYCYESDFNTTESSLFPVRSKKVQTKGQSDAKAGLIDLIHESNTQYYTQGSGRAGARHYDATRPGTDILGSSPTNNTSEAHHHGLSAVTSTSSSPAKQSTSASADAISGNTLRAFTDTVDALALQTSVLGKRDVLSAEEYARLAQQPTVSEDATRALLQSLQNIKSSPTNSVALQDVISNITASFELNSSPQPPHSNTTPAAVHRSANSTPQSDHASISTMGEQLSALNENILPQIDSSATSQRVNISSPVVPSDITDNHIQTSSTLLQAAFETPGVPLQPQYEHLGAEDTAILVQQKTSNKDIAVEKQTLASRDSKSSIDLSLDVDSIDSSIDSSSQDLNSSVISDASKADTNAAEANKSRSQTNDKKRNRKKKKNLIPVPRAEITTTIERSTGGGWLRRAACSNNRVAVIDKGEHVTKEDELLSDEDAEENKVEEIETVDGKVIELLQDEEKTHVTLFSEETIVAKEMSSGELTCEVNTELKDSDGHSVTESITSDSKSKAETMQNQLESTSKVNEKFQGSESEIRSDTKTEKSSWKANKTKKNREPACAQNEEVATNVDAASMATFLHHGYDPQAYGDYGALKRQLDTLMRARAKLEGQLEVMEIEAKESLQQRTQLQAQVSTMQQQLKAQEITVTTATSERDALQSDMRTMKETRASLEQVIVDTQKLIEDKDSDLKTVQEDLRLSHESNDKLQESLKQVKRDVHAKNSTIEDLKNKIAELYVQFETANQTRLLQEKEIESVRSELRSAAAAKEWYQQQLQQAQHAKNQLQREMTGVKSEVIGKATVLERLKADNVRLQQMLADTQQRIIQEKQLLAGQLEAIEADMLEREAAFAQIQRERDMLHSRLDGAPHDHQMATVQSAEAELSKDLESSRLQNDVRRKQAHIAVLEHEQTELMKRLALSQESILERDKNLESTEQKYIDVEVELKKLQQELSLKSEDLSHHHQEKSLLEMELRSLKEEKSSFDAVISNLKTDMTKVESSFQRIKQELTKKTDELNSIKQEKERQNEALATKEKLESGSSIVSSLPNFETEKITSESQTSEVKSEQSTNSELEKNLEDQNRDLKLQIDNLNSELKAQLESYESERLKLHDKISALENSAKFAEAPSTTHYDITTVFQQTLKEVYTSTQTIAHDVQELKDISKEDLVKLYSKDGASDEVSSLIDENCRLKVAILKLQQGQLGSPMSKEQVTSDVEAQHLPHKNEESLENERLVNAAAKEHESALQHEISELRTMCSQLETQLTQSSALAQSEKEALSAEIQDLTAQLQQAKQPSRHRDADAMMALTLELEKERGKLAGVVQQYTQMKQHAEELESRLAANQSEKVEHNLSSQQEHENQRRSLDELQAEVTTLRAALKKQDNAVKETKKQLITEKGNHVKTRRKYEALFVDHDQMRVDYEKRIKQVEEMAEALEKARERENAYRADHEKMSQELQDTRAVVVKLEQEVNQQREKDPVLADKIQTLEWQLREKEQELTATKQQTQLAEDRQTLEYNNMLKTLQANASELSRLREELTQTKREKAGLQTRVVDLKAALQSAVDSNKGGSAVQLDMTAIEALLKETHSPSRQSKPLSFIQATLSELRGEITTLQSHMDEHTSALQDSTLAWRELEQQVADLREVCKTTAADREATNDFIPPVPSTVIPQFTLPPSFQFDLPQQSNQKSTNDFAKPRIDGYAIENGTGSINDTAECSSLSKSSDVLKNGRAKKVDSTQVASNKSSPERRINTKAMELNSIYAPISK